MAVGRISSPKKPAAAPEQQKRTGGRRKADRQKQKQKRTGGSGRRRRRRRTKKKKAKAKNEDEEGGSPEAEAEAEAEGASHQAAPQHQHQSPPGTRAGTMHQGPAGEAAAVLCSHHSHPIHTRSTPVLCSHPIHTPALRQHVANTTYDIFQQHFANLISGYCVDTCKSAVPA
jgi:hypothetical protein